MKYRIKVIKKYSGEILYIPQYREDYWYIMLFFKLLVSPIVGICWMFFWSKKQITDIPNYFGCWHSIEYNKKTFAPISNLLILNDINAICSTRDIAEQVIALHKKQEQDKLQKEVNENYERRQHKTKSKTYIKIND